MLTAYADGTLVAAIWRLLTVCILVPDRVAVPTRPSGSGQTEFAVSLVQ